MQPSIGGSELSVSVSLELLTCSAAEYRGSGAPCQRKFGPANLFCSDSTMLLLTESKIILQSQPVSEHFKKD